MLYQLSYVTKYFFNIITTMKKSLNTICIDKHIYMRMFICTPNENRTRVPRMKILCTNHYTMGANNSYNSRRLVTIVITIYIIDSKNLGTGNVTIMFLILCLRRESNSYEHCCSEDFKSSMSTIPSLRQNNIWLINWFNHKNLCMFFTEVKTTYDE